MMNRFQHSITILWLSLLLLFSASASAQISGTGYELELAPGVNILGNSDGTHTVGGAFNLFNEGIKSQDLGAADFTVYESDTKVNAVITPPGAGGVQLADIVFCMDVSGSMNDNIAKVKNNTRSFVNGLNARNIDVRLGLITFGDYYKPYLRVRNNGDFYPAPEDFIQEVSALRESGSKEQWFDAVALASQYRFRAGAARIVILITDESGNSLNYGIGSAIAAVTKNSTRVYSITLPQLTNAMDAATRTGGSVYHINDPFDSILDSIAVEISNTYKLSYVSDAPCGPHDLKVEINRNGNLDTVSFELCNNPKITLLEPSADDLKNGVAADGTPLPIRAEITDNGAVTDVKISGILEDGTRFSDTMTDEGGNIYSYEGVRPSLGQCIRFSIQALDDEGFSTLSPEWTVCAGGNQPGITNITPDAYDYDQAFTVGADVVDADGDLDTVEIKYRAHGTQAWTHPMPMAAFGDTFSFDMPASDAGFDGVDVKILARDLAGGLATLEKTILVRSAPVKIIDVTRYTDTLDEGPYSVYAVIAGIDLSQGSSATLLYSINGSQSSVPMIRTVTGTAGSFGTNSNIYFAEIPVQSQGDTVCYHVEADNPPSGHDASTETCFEILQPAAPIALTPASAIVTPGESVSFLATGGYGTYEWSGLNGDLSTTLGDSTTYTSTIIANGWDKVVVKDIKGFTATASIRVVPNLTVTPDVNGKRFSPSSTVQLSAGGGEPDYSWKVENADSFTVSDDKSSVEIVLGASLADIKVTLTDSKGRATTVTFRNNGLLVLSPWCDVQVATGGEQSFSVSGGQEPYSWTVVGGELDSYNTAAVTYKAPELPGTYHITVEDSIGDSATAKLMVGTPLRVTPNIARIMRGETAEFEVVTGTPPYKWEAMYGKLSSTTGGKIVYTPEDHLGLYPVTVTDGAGSSMVLLVDVTEGLVVTPAVIDIEKGKTVEIKVTGGTGGYTWSSTRGTVAPLNGPVTTYTPPSTIGTDEVVVRDSSGNSANISVTVTAGPIDKLRITPESATLSPGETIDFSVINAKNPGDIKWTTTKGMVDANGKYTASSSSGTYVVAVLDLQNGRKAEASVKVKSTLQVTPEDTVMKAQESVTFTVSGGEAPYNWRVVGEGTLDATEGDAVEFTAGSKSGISTLIVVDNTGESASTDIDVSGLCRLSPAKVSLPPGGTQQFTPICGGGNLTWSAERGNIDSSGLYTAPSDIGVYMVEVDGGNGYVSTAIVEVGNLPVITPAMDWLGTGDTGNFTVVGGTPPYSWTVTAGSIDTTGKDVVFTASNVSSEVTVTVTDSLGQESTAVAYVDLPLRASKEEIYLEPGDTARVAVTGGIPPFEWATGTGEMKDIHTEDAGFNYYTAPRVMGDDAITIRDRNGDTISVKVKVMTVFKVTPAIRYMERQKDVKFTAVGGEPPYRAVVAGGADGDISPTESEDGVFTFTSGTTKNEKVVIEFEDNAGQKFETHAWVEISLKAGPTVIYVDKGAKAQFSVSGGTGGYDVWADSGFAEVDAATGRGTFEAPGRYGNYTLHIFDSSDETVEIVAEVAPTAPVVSPSVVNMAPGETRTFMVNLGAAPYLWTFEGDMVTCLDGDASTVEITAPAAAGVYKLTATDAAGNKAEATVNVNLALLVSPSTLTVFQGTTPSIRISAQGGTRMPGTGAYDWVLAGLEEVKRADDYIVVKPATRVEAGTEYSVTCRDALGADVKMTIIVSRIPGDLDGNGSLSEAEMLNVIDNYMDDASVQGIKMDPQLVYSHIEAYLGTR